MGSEDLLNIIRREVYRVVSHVTQPRIGLVDSYDPDRHAAKVRFQPEDTLSGWLPIMNHSLGNGWGMAFGLNVGDQVQVSFQEGDNEVGMIVGRVPSDKDRPPRALAGEMILKHQAGGTIRFNQDGSVDIDNTGREVRIKGQIKINP